MKHYFDCYHYFLSGTLTKIILYLLYPLATLGIAIPICSIGRGLTEVSLVVTGLLIWSIELLMDFLYFGGMPAKETNKFTFLQTSQKGLPLLQKALHTDLFRKTLSTTLLLLISPCTKLNWTNLWKVVVTILTTLLLLELSQLVTRRITSLTIYTLFFAMTTWIYATTTAFFLLEALEHNTFLQVITCLLLTVAVFGIHCLGEKWIVSKARNSFYDEKA